MFSLNYSHKGVGDVNEIVEKYLNRNETRHFLQKSISDMTERVQELQQQVENLRNELSKVSNV